MSKTGAIERWRAWAGSFSNRHRRLAARIAGLTSVLAKPRAASRIVRESWLLSSRTLQPHIHLSIQPLLRFDLRPAVPAPQILHQTNSLGQTSERFDRRPAAEAPQSLREILHETRRRSSESHTLAERFRQTDSSTTRVLETVKTRPISEAPRIAPLSLVLQRLRKPERALAVQRELRAQEGPASRPALARYLADKVRREERPDDTPVARVLREDAPASRNDRDPADAARSFPTMPPRTAPDLWREAPAATAIPTAAAMISPAGVEALTEKVMHQIDQRLHAWRERRGGF